MDKKKIKLNIQKKLRQMKFTELSNEEIKYANEVLQFLETCLAVEIQ